MWDVSDVHNDIKEHLGVVGSSVGRRILGRHVYQRAWGNNITERTSLLPDAVGVDKTATAASPGYYASENSSSSECIDEVTISDPQSIPGSKDVTA